MRKSTSLRKTGRTRMGSNLTDPEVDAALQLIQLSGDSTDSKFGGGGGRECDHSVKEEESVGDTTGSTAADEISSATNISVIADNLDEDVACLPRKRKFRSVVDLYMKTKPLIKKQGEKARKI